MAVTPALLAGLVMPIPPQEMDETPELGTDHFSRSDDGALVIFVSPAGSDSWSGRLATPSGAIATDTGKADGPLATPHAARDRIRSLRATGWSGAFTVRLRDGCYRSTRPFILEPQDSGGENAPVTYEAYPGENPVVSGGRKIAGWHRTQSGGWTVLLPEVKDGGWFFHQLFVNDRRAVRARSPNEGYYRTTGQLTGFDQPHQHRGNSAACMGFAYRKGDLRGWPDVSDANLLLYHSWTSSLHWIDSIDEEKNLVRFTNRSAWPVGWRERGNQRYHVENLRAALDQPGEWCLDRSTGELNYLPCDGEDPATTQVIAPVLGRLVSFAGNGAEDRWVEHIVLRGISFRHTDWHVPSKTAMADGQAATFLPATVHLQGTRYCVNDGCEIVHVGTYGVWFDEGARDNCLVRSEIHDLGGGGVRIGRGQTAASPGLSADRNLVDNCYVHHGGRVFPAGCGVLIQRGSYNRITHNEIAFFYYTGLSIGWSWGYASSTAHHNEAAFNHVHHLGQGVLSDTGGIYTLGVSPETRIHHNVFHHIQSYSYGGWGLYTDEGSTGIVLDSNLVFDTKTGGFHQHYGRDNRIVNNILAFSDQHQLQRTRNEEHNSFTFERNIVVFDNGNLLGGDFSNDRFIMDRNIYWDTRGQGFDWAGADLATWRQRGHDQHSLVADPLFLASENRDFRLRPGSPAESIGFSPFDVAEAGLYGDPARVGKPTAEDSETETSSYRTR